MRFSLFLLLFTLVSPHLYAQTPDQPKLIIGIVVDQMRYDFLYRYDEKYTSQGFKRLLKEGFSYENTLYNYMPTLTGPGHAAIYTGTGPAVNGIIANEWWDPEWKRGRYVTLDTTVRPVPRGVNKKSAQHSPRVLLSTTITDELRLGTNFRSKVVGVCLKDRASILPAGHIPNAAYWFDDKSGNWITSSYYQPTDSLLPAWVSAFNARRLPDTYLSKNWDKISSSEYVESFLNWDKYDDGTYSKNLKSGFPIDLPALKKAEGYGVIRFTPWGNTLTLDFAREAIEQMELGQDDITDFLCLSFSSTDYCAHQFGIHAQETQDLYMRLDQEIAGFLEYLDKKFGKNNVLVFLTADHGGAETPTHMIDLKIPAGVFEESKLKGRLEQAITAATGLTGNFIHDAANQQIWLNWDALADFDQDPDDIAAIIIDYLRRQPGVYDAYTRTSLMMLPTDLPFVSEIRRGIHPRRSGDILFQLDPAWHPDDGAFKVGGTTHGSPYPYDTHVPLVWYGWKIRPGVSHLETHIADIAPTLAAMLRIMRPNGCTGKVLEEVVPR
jgi:predicted AlkP superfamily pyrophosphatase or phosphodiesterase